MGMYSNFSYEGIEIRDWEGLLNFLDLWNKEFPDDWKIEGMIVNKKKKEITFSNWDNIKLISYWYDDEIVFLDCIAEFIEGEVRWTFETDDEGGYVLFRDKKCIIVTGRMEWNENSPEEMMYERGEFGLNLKTDKLNEKLERLRGLKNL